MVVSSLLDHLRGKVLRGELRIVQEEGLAFDGNLGDSLAVRRDVTAVVHLDARELLEEVDQHVRIGGLEGGGVIFDRVLLDDDRVTGCGDGSGIQDFLVQVHLDGAEVGGFLCNLNRLLNGLVTHDFGLEGVLAGLDLFDGTLTVVVGQRVLGVTFFGSEGDGGEADGLAVGGVFQFHGHIVILG